MFEYVCVPYLFIKSDSIMLPVKACHLFSCLLIIMNRSSTRRPYEGPNISMWFERPHFIKLILYHRIRDRFSCFRKYILDNVISL